MKKRLKAENDAYGQEVWAYLNGRESYEIVERDDGFIDLSAGAETYFQPFSRWPRHQKRAIRLARGRVLDIGAGAGRVSLHLQKKGLKVTAIDQSPFAIRCCRKRGVRDARVRPIEEVAELKPSVFHTVVMYGNNFGLFGSIPKARRLLKILHRMTTTDALILAESNDPYKTRDPVHLAYHRFNRRRGRLSGQLRIRVRFRTFVGNWFDYLFVSRAEMKAILRGTGWKVRKWIDSGRSAYIAVMAKESFGEGLPE